MAYSSFAVNHSNLFGLRQAFMGSSYTPPPLSDSICYKVGILACLKA